MNPNKPRLLKSKEDKEQFIFWIETLRAEILPKGKYKLEINSTYCCLGVGMACNTDGPIYGWFPEVADGSPMWLANLMGHVSKNYGFEVTLANDGSGGSKELTHPQIADKLWELYSWELE